MGDSNKRICQLCFDKAPASECETLDEMRKAMLEFLLININSGISDCPVACNMCLERLQESFDFKSRCSKALPRKMISNTGGIGNISLGSFQVCRLCMSPKNELDGNYITNINDGVLLKEMIEYCFPEMNLNDDNEPTICKLCLICLQGFHKFLKSCREVERLCSLVTPGTADIPILEEAFLKSEDVEELGKSIIIKKECLDAENDINPALCLKNEDIPNIKCEELVIKDESGAGEMADSVSSGAYKNSRQSSSKRKFTSKDRKDLKHKETSEVEMHKCQNCEYETRYKPNMRMHMLKHRDPNAERKFKCDKCPYVTDFKSGLRRHTLRHKDKSEVEMHKCENCEYETRYKDNMIKHMLKHHTPKAERKFKCNKCPYDTDFESDLRRHTLRHKDKSEVEMHKCENCEFETRYKSNMTMHMLKKHGYPKAARKFKCDKCPYQTDLKSTLRQHNLIHKDKSEVEMHKCENCEYETRHKGNIIQHMLKHRDPKAEKKFKCEKCAYETDCKSHLLRHGMIHKDKSEMKMHKCENCDYETRYKCNIIQHMLRHRDPKVGRKFKCKNCTYDTDRKFHLLRHNLAIHNPNRWKIRGSPA